LAEEKTVGPTPALVFLGLEIDTQGMAIRTARQTKLY
jgi:hypothetical protein